MNKKELFWGIIILLVLAFCAFVLLFEHKATIKREPYQNGITDVEIIGIFSVETYLNENQMKLVRESNDYEDFDVSVKFKDGFWKLTKFKKNK